MSALVNALRRALTTRAAEAPELASAARAMIDRARRAGYPITAYRGMKEAYEPRDAVQFFAATPRTAQTYAQAGDRVSGAIMPSQLRIDRPLVIDMGGRQWDEVPLDRLRAAGLASEADAGARGRITTQDVARLARESGDFDGVIFRNMRERWKEPGPSVDWVDDVYAVWEPAQIRLRHARYSDPSSRDPLAGLAIAAPTGLASALAARDRSAS